MKRLSESLEVLAGRVQKLEDSATATIEADRAKLEARRQQIDEAFKTDIEEFESAARKAADEGRTWWNDAKAALRRPLDELRARVEKRKAEHEVHKVLRTADAAEEDAAAAVEVAAYFVNVAEYAVIDATLARMAADDLVDAPTTGAKT
jgi:DNA repair exonuclease SbcCD ATPase subunit